jgi:hypothetical protein
MVMLPRDHQYRLRPLPTIAAMAASGHFECSPGSRIFGVGAATRGRETGSQ